MSETKLKCYEIGFEGEIFKVPVDYVEKIIEQTQLDCNKNFNEFIEKVKKASDEQDFDIMLEEADNGDITIPFSEYIENLAKKEVGK